MVMTPEEFWRALMDAEAQLFCTYDEAVTAYHKFVREQAASAAPTPTESREREQTSVCPSCDGKKRIDGIMCGFCEGTGSIRNVFPPLPLTESREGGLPCTCLPLPEPSAEAIESFVMQILHGDEEHRDWLMAAANAFLTGEPIPKAAGKGSKEQIAALIAERDKLKEDLATVAEMGCRNCAPTRAEWKKCVERVSVLTEALEEIATGKLDGTNGTASYAARAALSRTAEEAK